MTQPGNEPLERPGSFPYTRGVYPGMHRDRLWTMRQYAGLGDAAESNRRYHYLLSQGITGLSVAFDLPTQMGYDSDHPRSLGEVGRAGVSISSLRDMEQLFAGIPQGDVSTSMTINSTASILLALYAAAARKQGVDLQVLRGTVQNDVLKEYIARGTYIYPPQASMRIVTDLFAWAGREMPKWNVISISGYHMREAGSTAPQEVAFTLANAFAYIEAALSAGLAIDDFAPRLSFFFSADRDFLEEIAKFRAARRLYARSMKERFQPKNDASLKMRFHTQTAGSSLMAQQPYVNVMRTAYEALAAVLGGTQSLHTNGFDEALALPTEQAAKLALRTQQVIAEETGVVNTADPVGGSYEIERLTDRIEEEAREYLDRIDALGGMPNAIEQGYVQREIENAAYGFQRRVESGEQKIIGVNAFQSDESESVPTVKIDPALETRRREELDELRTSRDSAGVERRLEALTAGAKGEANLMTLIVDAVECYATLGEVSDALRGVFSEYQGGAGL